MQKGGWEAGGLPVVALAGNPNVGKSTLFNALTGMHQHTGNWPGKTVCGAQGICKTERGAFLLVDTPGAYSLVAHSAEEEVTRDFLFAGRPAATVVVCDATCLERNLNLVLQILELSPHVFLCVNLMDEAERKHIRVDLAKLQHLLGIPVFGVTARKKKTLAALTAALTNLLLRNATGKEESGAFLPTYEKETEEKLARVLPIVQAETGERDPRRLRFLSLCFLEGREKTWTLFRDAYDPGWTGRVIEKWDGEQITEAETGAALVQEAERIAGLCVARKAGKKSFDRALDRVLTGKLTAFPVMLLLLAGIFWLTVSGANYPSAWLSGLFAKIGHWLGVLFSACRAPAFIKGLLLDGVYRTLSWVISVMLPPMAIFFPLFTLLEDAGFLPRIAYNLDRPFQCCHACGKQGLCMCMGFGCNAAGVVGCRIIDSPRERLLAVLTNGFVPCNGRFPAIISVLLLFFAGGGAFSSLRASLLLTGIVLFSILATFAATKLLAVTILRGTPSAFTLELPPYRPPQIGRVLVRSVLDRTLFVLGRAAVVAAPAGAVIWLLSYFSIGDRSLLLYGAGFLDSFARLLGLDGVILLAFILGFPANEIVIPIALMMYTAGTGLTEAGTLAETGAVLLANGWSKVTGICFILFSVLHFPCSTTLMTVKKETGSIGYTLLAAALPTAFGMLICFLINGLFSFL